MRKGGGSKTGGCKREEGVKERAKRGGGLRGSENERDRDG